MCIYVYTYINVYVYINIYRYTYVYLYVCNKLQLNWRWPPRLTIMAPSWRRYCPRMSKIPRPRGAVNTGYVSLRLSSRNFANNDARNWFCSSAHHEKLAAYRQHRCTVTYYERAQHSAGAQQQHRCMVAYQERAQPSAVAHRQHRCTHTRRIHWARVTRGHSAIDARRPNWPA